MSVGGVLTSGAVVFPTADACEAGAKSWGQAAIAVADKIERGPYLNARCIRRETGKT